MVSLSQIISPTNENYRVDKLIGKYDKIFSSNGG